MLKWFELFRGKLLYKCIATIKPLLIESIHSFGCRRCYLLLPIMSLFSNLQIRLDVLILQGLLQLLEMRDGLTPSVAKIRIFIIITKMKHFYLPSLGHVSHLCLNYWWPKRSFPSSTWLCWESLKLKIGHDFVINLTYELLQTRRCLDMNFSTYHNFKLQPTRSGIMANISSQL